jgi:hypothetical protein
LFRHNQSSRRTPVWPLIALAFVFGIALVAGYWTRQSGRQVTLSTSPSPKPIQSESPSDGAGSILGIDDVTHFTATEAEAISRQNYGSIAPVITTSLTKVTFHYRSFDTDKTPLIIYGRAYLPDTGEQKLPIFAFAPGTTGIGDQCAGSLENITKANWGNYDSHMLTYASQGYAAVITDYEGMRDPSRLHHYMVGALEGRAVLDSIRALKNLPQASDRLDLNQIFTAGYSQGGHAAFWADTLNASYAPDIKLTGVIGYGPVLSVEETMNDVTRGSILDWFGPYVLASYADYYHHTYKVSDILQGRYASTLLSDVTSHCVESDYAFWGHDDAHVYTPMYLSAVLNGTINRDFPALSTDLELNATGNEKTSSAKLINQGKYDAVVLPAQAESALPSMCQNSTGPVALKVYGNATHFNTMVVSLNDTLAWMREIRAGSKSVSTCPPAS